MKKQRLQLVYQYIAKRGLPEKGKPSLFEKVLA